MAKAIDLGDDAGDRRFGCLCRFKRGDGFLEILGCGGDVFANPISLGGRGGGAQLVQRQVETRAGRQRHGDRAADLLAQRDRSLDILRAAGVLEQPEPAGTNVAFEPPLDRFEPRLVGQLRLRARQQRRRELDVFVQRRAGNFASGLGPGGKTNTQRLVTGGGEQAHRRWGVFGLDDADRPE